MGVSLVIRVQVIVVVDKLLTLNVKMPLSNDSARGSSKRKNICERKSSMKNKIMAETRIIHTRFKAGHSCYVL